MAGSVAPNQLNQFVRTLELAACGVVLGKGRAMQRSGRWTSVGGDDVFDCWRRSLGPHDTLPTVYNIPVSCMDSGGDGEGRVVLVSHGSPGSHNDFKYMVPTLLQKNIRVIGPNYPGHGRTPTPKYYRQSNDERAEFVLDCVKACGLNKVDVLVGHSAGCYPLVKLAADETYWADGRPVCRTLVLVNPGGFLQPHKSLRPYWLVRLGSRLFYSPIGWLIEWLQYVVWRYVLRFRITSAEQAVSGTNMAANIGLSRLPGFVGRIATDHGAPRVLILYAEDDHFVEKERCEEVAVALGIDLVFPVGGNNDLDNALEHIRAWWRAKGQRRHAAVVFKKGLGGHYLQKHQAAFIVYCLDVIVSNTAE